MSVSVQLCLVCVLAGCVTRPSSVSADSNTHLLDDVMTGLENVVNFFSEDYSSVNVDGLYGLRITQGTLLQSLSWCARKCPDDLIDKLTQLEHTIDVTANKSLGYIQNQDLAYYNQFHPTIDSPFLIEPTNMTVDKTQLVPGTDSRYHERRGDACFANLFGTYTENTAKCTVTDSCLDMMTQENTADYSITHKLLYFILGEKMGCTEILNTKLSDRGLSSVKTTERQQCSHIFAEAEQNVINGNVLESKQDLFLEQSLLCGMVGFQEFLQPAWVRMVLRWQTARGCFTLNESLAKWQSLLIRLLREDDMDIKYKPWSTQRRLLREQVMEGNCLSHKSGLGAGLLGVFQRHIIHSINW